MELSLRFSPKARILYFKVGDTNHADYVAAGSEPFTYESRGKRAAMSYWKVPSEILDDGESLRSWAEKAYRVSFQNKSDEKNGFVLDVFQINGISATLDNHCHPLT